MGNHSKSKQQRSCPHKAREKIKKFVLRNKQLILFFIFQDALTVEGRARIEHQKQITLANIQKNKEAALTALNIQYANADKVKTSFGYIGITFLIVLFGSIFLNDFIKLCIYFWINWKEWWKGINNDQIQVNTRVNNEAELVQLEMDHAYGELLEENLKRVYIRLLEINSNRKRISDETNA